MPLGLTRSLVTILLGSILALVSTLALAATESQTLPANTNVFDKASLQRGAALYMNYCSGCHSLQFQRYSRMAADLNLSEAQVMENLNFTSAKFGETIDAAMTPADGEVWFGQAPPDLSLVARARGPDWIYTYLKSFYLDETRPLGWNNSLFANASMPHVLWPLQGSQRAVYAATDTGLPVVERLELASPGRLEPREYDRAVRDITAFLQYVGEPAVLQREAWGVWVILFLALFTFLAWLLKIEYWRDVH